MTEEKILEVAGDTYRPEPVWAKQKHISLRTSTRYRNRKPGLPYLQWGGQIWIGDRAGDAYIASLIRQRNPRSQQRRHNAEQGAARRRGRPPKRRDGDASPSATEA